MADEKSEFRSYFEHFEHAHRRLQRVLAETEEALRAAGARVNVTEFWDRLQILRDAMAQHFREEEEGGCLEEAVCRCPSLASGADALLGEHQQLLQDVNLLMARITQERDLASTELDREFARLAERLRRHEGSEHEILAKAFGMSLLADDNAS